MPSISSFTFPSADGKTTISVRRCVPDTQPIAVLQIAHGIAEHSARYDDFAMYMASHGFVVVTNDHLGHGKSIDGPESLGYFADKNGWSLAVEDMHTLHEMMMEDYSLPYYLFGHSMGSFLTRTYIIYHRSGLSGVILSGTGRQTTASISAGRLIGQYEAKRHGLRYKSERINTLAFGGYNKGFPAAKTVSDWLSRDAAVVDEYIKDELCGYIPTVGLFLDMFDGLSIIGSRKKLNHMNKNLPVLFISGDKDPVGENGAGVIAVYRSFLDAGMQDVTLKLYHNGRHEMLNELNKADVYCDVLSWIRGNMLV